MAEEQDVTETDSSPVEATTPETAPVSGETRDARPVENWQAEFRRKQEKTQQQLDAVLSWIATQAQPQRTPVYAQPQPQQQGQVSDEELLAAAQQGDVNASMLYQQRMMDRRLAERDQANRKQQAVQGQLGALMRQYPVLNNPSHPLTQYVNQAYTVMVQQGYPAGQETLLDAAKTAIADRPDLVAEIYNQGSQAREQSRRTAAQQAQTGVTGATHRQDPTPRQQGKRPITKEQAELARRMGVPDPAKAIERFTKRREKGLSSFGAVGGFINEDDL